MIDTKSIYSPILLKDRLINLRKVEQIAHEIHKIYPLFKTDAFITLVTSEFDKIELKARISCIANGLRKHLPNDYSEALSIILQALPAPNNPELSDGDFGDFIYASYGCFVAQYGCNQQYIYKSLDALYKITQIFSTEDAIRYFINNFPSQTMDCLEKWSADPNYHVRRLCSEGTRPKLPWSPKINIPYALPIKILDNLYTDPTRFVVRSVANHLNDLSKIDAKLVINTLKKWQESPHDNIDEMNYLTRHALRTLVKWGNPSALQLLGFSHNPQITLQEFKITKKIKLNTKLEFSFKIKAQHASKIVIDYVIFFSNKAGEVKSKKIFKLKNLYLKSGEEEFITKSHLMKENMTTRKIYRGRHRVEIKINGENFTTEEFLVI